jgi:sorting nexin-8
MFIRHERLSGDQVDALKKKVATNSIKMDGIKAAQKDGWKEQADKIAVSIEKDNATIQAQLHRRLFIRAW